MVATTVQTPHNYILFICPACGAIELDRPMPAVALTTRIHEGHEDIGMIGIPLQGSFTDAQRVALEKAIKGISL